MVNFKKQERHLLKGSEIQSIFISIVLNLTINDLEG